jgi:hypothetical protein
MSMNDHFDAILKEIPKRESRSKLEPYARLIEELLRRGRTYREIVSVLHERCGVPVSLSTLHFFVRHRAASGKKTRAATTSHSKIQFNLAPQNGGMGNNSMTPPENRDEVLQRIAALKSRPILKEPKKELFEYDPDEPLLIPVKTNPK